VSQEAKQLEYNTTNNDFIILFLL